MSNQSRSTPFPASQEDISKLKQTATDALNDLGSTAAVHASKVKGQARELAGHLRDEGADKIDEFRGRVSDLVFIARDFAVERPFTCIGVALAVGFLIGVSRRRSSR